MCLLRMEGALPVRECPGDRSGPAAPRWQRLMREVGRMPKYAIVEAPSALGHVPEHRGVERAPEVLLGAGLADGLAARQAGRVEAAGYSAPRDPGTQVMNPQAIRDYSPLLADAVTAVLGEGEFPVVLGGDCSILLGTMLALRRRGRGGPGARGEVWGRWWCPPAVTLLTRNAGAASRCRQACWSLTVTRSAGS